MTGPDTMARGVDSDNVGVHSSNVHDLQRDRDERSMNESRFS